MNFLKLEYENKKLFIYQINGEKWFVGRYVCEILEYANPKDTIKRHCKKEGVVKKYLPTSSGMQEMTLINFPNLLRLIMRSKMKKAENFQDWVVEKVLPEIIDTGSYTIFKETDKILKHQDEKIQKQNSKSINSTNYKQGGIQKVREHNIEICKILTNRTPSEIKQLGKDFYNLKSIERTSAKEVLRRVCPPKAQAMSFTEELLKQHKDKTIQDFKETALKATQLYNELTKVGIDLDDFEKKITKIN